MCRKARKMSAKKKEPIGLIAIEAKLLQLIRNSGLLPTYTEVGLFLISLTALLLFATDPVFNQTIVNTIKSDIRVAFVLILSVGGGFLSIYHAFAKSRIGDVSKYFMLYSALCMNCGAAFAAYFHLMEHTRQFMYLALPVFNALSSLFMLGLLRAEVITADSAADRQAKLWEVILGSIMVTSLYFLSFKSWENHWSITFSICTVYSTNVNENINRLVTWFKPE